MSKQPALKQLGIELELERGKRQEFAQVSVGAHLLEAAIRLSNRFKVFLDCSIQFRIIACLTHPLTPYPSPDALPSPNALPIPSRLTHPLMPYQPP